MTGSDRQRVIMPLTCDDKRNTATIRDVNYHTF